jgi:IS30 family transposase
MVFLRRRRPRYGAVGRRENRCMRSAVPSAKTMARFISCYRSTRIVPAVRRRSERTLTLAEREEISRGIASGSSIREIARNLQRAASTVSREVARHGGRPRYRASKADHQAWKSAMRPRPCLLALYKQLRTIVARKLILNWSPEQISGWLKRRYPTNESMRVSHETIYRSLFVQARGVC